MSRKRKAALVAVVLALATGTGVAIALWSASGTGTGQAKALTAHTITVNASTGAADLYPGFTGGDLYFTLTNSNPYAVTFTSMTAGTVTSSDSTGCPASNATVGNASGRSLKVAANSTSGQLSIADVVSLASGAPNGCQGVTFNVSITLSGSQD
ncbi:MAG: hypothetical protein WD598_13385 [Acidimicrobiia bacterium]